MSKTLTTDLKNHYASEVTTISTCWKLTRRDDVVLGFTDADVNIKYLGVNYLASTGFNATSIQSASDMTIDNLEVDGYIDADVITFEDLKAGIYDNAEIEIFQINRKSVDDGIITLRKGKIGNLKFNGNGFTCEIRGLLQQLTVNILEQYTPYCRANLGDSRCTVDMTTFTFAGTIEEVTDNRVLVDSTFVQVDDYFNYGILTMTSGDASGYSLEVKTFENGGIFNLILPFEVNVQVGDTFSVKQGCDKTKATCIARYNNLLNFRGEPYIPGFDRAVQTSGTIRK